jgi:hypothetical protein
VTLSIEVTPADLDFLVAVVNPFDMVAMNVWDMPEGYELPAGITDDVRAAAMRETHPGFTANAVGGGLRFRAKLLTMRDQIKGAQGSAPLALTLAELWTLDYVIHRADINWQKEPKLSDGTPLLTLAEKVWHAVRLAYMPGPTVQEETLGSRSSNVGTSTDSTESTADVPEPGAEDWSPNQPDPTERARTLSAFDKLIDGLEKASGSAE